MQTNMLALSMVLETLMHIHMDRYRPNTERESEQVRLDPFWESYSFAFVSSTEYGFFYFGCNLLVRSGLIWSKATSFIFGRNGHGSTPLIFVRAHSIIGDADRINHCVESVVFTSFVKVLGPRNDIVKDNIKLQINY